MEKDVKMNLSDKLTHPILESLGFKPVKDIFPDWIFGSADMCKWGHVIFAGHDEFWYWGPLEPFELTLIGGYEDINVKLQTVSDLNNLWKQITGEYLIQS